MCDWCDLFECDWWFVYGECVYYDEVVDYYLVVVIFGIVDELGDVDIVVGVGDVGYLYVVCYVWCY